MDSAELFSFEAPSDQGCSLIFNNAPLEVDDSDIIAFFEEGVGPVYRLFFFDNPENKGKRSGLVTYYCKRDCLKAREAMRGGKVLGDKKIFVHANTLKPKENCDVKYHLPVNNCIEAANHFIGYNHWSSAIDGFEVISSDSSGAPPNVFRVRVRCSISLIIRKDNQCVPGIGEGESEESDQLQALSSAKKKALGMARIDAFQRISIVLFPNDKTFLHLKDAMPLKPAAPKGDEGQGPIVVERVVKQEPHSSASYSSRKRKFSAGNSS